MKKNIVRVLCFLLSLLLTTSPALALDIQITDNGSIYMYDDAVLGKNTEGKPASNVDTRPALKTVPAQTNKAIRVTPQAENLRVDITNSRLISAKLQDRRFEPVETHTTDRLRMQAPADYSEDQLEQFRRDQQAGESATQTPDPATDQLRTRTTTYQESLRADRQLRENEVMELRNQIRDNRQELELETRGVIARLRGAEFSLDPTSNELTITTPSGVIHRLNHLPDQALERMRASGLLDEELELADEVTVVADDEQLEYRSEIREVRRLLGLFPRESISEIVLDDMTGEVRLETEEGTNWDNFLNSLSF